MTEFELIQAALNCLIGYYQCQKDNIEGGGDEWKEHLIQAKPSDVNDVEFWEHWIVEVVDQDEKLGYKNNWEKIYLKILQLV